MLLYEFSVVWSYGGAQAVQGQWVVRSADNYHAWGCVLFWVVGSAVWTQYPNILGLGAWGLQILLLSAAAALAATFGYLLLLLRRQRFCS